MAPVNFQTRDISQILEDVRYAVQVAESYINQIQGVGLHVAGLQLLELGPGINFGPALVLTSLGVNVSLADRYLAPWQESYHPAFYRALQAEWHGDTSAIARVLHEGRHEGTLRLIHEPAEALVSAKDCEFDLVMSNAVLEHVYDFEAVTNELARVTRPGGINLHQIDYRDHSSFDRPLEFLLEDHHTYIQEFTANSCERGNRVRPTEAEAMLEAAGFTINVNAINMRVPEDYFEQFLPRLRISNSEFRSWPEADLRNISGLIVAARDSNSEIANSGRSKMKAQKASKVENMRR